MAAARSVVLDDRLLIEEVLVGLPRRRRRLSLLTTTYWYYRACRAAVAGAGGHLSGPFAELPERQQSDAILALLQLPDRVALPDMRAIVPVMADVAQRHPRLNLLNLEAVAVGVQTESTIWLSPPAGAGVLPEVLDAEGVPWQVVAP